MLLFLLGFAVGGGKINEDSVSSSLCYIPSIYVHLPPNPEHTFLRSPHPLISIRINKTQWGNGEKSDPLLLFNLKRAASTETTGTALGSTVARLG